MEIGFFQHSKKMWINNRLDVNGMWKVVTNGGKVMLWCVGIGESTSNHGQKRSHDDSDPEREPASKRGKPSNTSVESLKSNAKEYELQLKAKHNDTYTPFQYKLWAEMYAKGAHNSLEEPPHAAMFQHETKQSKSSHDHAAVMVTVIDKLCSALTPKQIGNDKRAITSTLSPMKKAELRSTYMKQLSELRQLHDNGVLTEDKYEEQREELVQLMRQLKNKDKE